MSTKLLSGAVLLAAALVAQSTLAPMAIAQERSLRVTGQNLPSAPATPGNAASAPGANVGRMVNQQQSKANAKRRSQDPCRVGRDNFVTSAMYFDQNRDGQLAVYELQNLLYTIAQQQFGRVIGVSAVPQPEVPQRDPREQTRAYAQVLQPAPYARVSRPTGFYAQPAQPTGFYAAQVGQDIIGEQTGQFVYVFTTIAMQSDANQNGMLSEEELSRFAAVLIQYNPGLAGEACAQGRMGTRPLNVINAQLSGYNERQVQSGLSSYQGFNLNPNATISTSSGCSGAASPVVTSAAPIVQIQTVNGPTTVTTTTPATPAPAPISSGSVTIQQSTPGTFIQR